MKEGAFLVLNPSAGHGRQVDALHELLTRHRGVEVGECREKGDVRRLTQRGLDLGYPTIIAAGGDGTIGEVVNVIGANRPGVRLGILPMGTANDFAKTMEIPEDLGGALAIALDLHERDIDLVRVESTETRLVINAISGGLSVTAQEQMDPDVKRRWGGLAYFRAALSALPQADVYRCRLVIEGTSIELEAHGVLLANGQYAGGLRLIPSAEPDDDHMDVCLVVAETFAERAKLLAEFMIGRHLEDEDVFYRRVKNVRIESEPEMRFHSDGEPIGCTPATFHLLPGALRIASPPAPDAK